MKRASIVTRRAGRLAAGDAALGRESGAGSRATRRSKRPHSAPQEQHPIARALTSSTAVMRPCAASPATVRTCPSTPGPPQRRRKKPSVPTAAAMGHPMARRERAAAGQVTAQGPGTLAPIPASPSASGSPGFSAAARGRTAAWTSASCASACRAAKASSRGRALRRSLEAPEPAGVLLHARFATRMQSTFLSISCKRQRAGLDRGAAAARFPSNSPSEDLP